MTTPSAEYLDQPFDQAILFFKQKINLPTERWDELWREMHARAFTVAGAMQEELLQDLREAVEKAISQGTTISEFRKDFDRAVARYGWSYKGSRGWRTAVIYNTNLSVAYARGHYQQMTDPDVLAARPYLRYVRTSSATPRTEHLGWANTVLLADDPWWQTHYPPNGWGCKCGVVSMSGHELERLSAAGVRLRTTAPEIRYREVVNKKTGEIYRVPEGIDPGWDYHVGRAGFEGMQQ